MSTDSPPLRLGFAGTPEFALPALDALVKTQGICAVFTQPDRPAGRGRSLNASPVKSRAVELGLTVHQPASLKTPEALQLLRGLALDALVVVAYGLILPPAALACPRLGCINIHASLLPRWRGAAPIQRALLAGDAKTGVTIMRMNAGLDTGPLLASREMELTQYDTAQTVHHRLASLGAELIVDTLDSLNAGRLLEIPQPSDGVTYAEKVNKAEAVIDWREDAAQVSRRVRAFNPWPIAETRLEGEQLRVFRAAVVEELDPAQIESKSGKITLEPGVICSIADDGVIVQCGRGQLSLRELQRPGKRAVPAAEFIRGIQLTGRRLG